MPPNVSPIFSYHGRRGSQFYESELVEFLCPQPFAGEKPLKTPLALGAGATVDSGSGGDKYSFALAKSADGSRITLEAQLTRGGVMYKTEVQAARVKDDLYQITALTFDNHPERLDSRWEISKVLAHIGQQQLQKACRGDLPEAHREKGKFGRFARFRDRCLPDDPSVMMFPPPC